MIEIFKQKHLIIPLILLVICVGNSAAVTINPDVTINTTNTTTSFSAIAVFDNIAVTNDSICFYEYGVWSNLTITPTDNITLLISEWDSTDIRKKIWSETLSTPGIITTYSLTGFPTANKIRIDSSGYEYTTLTSDENGAITFISPGEGKISLSAYITQSQTMYDSPASIVTGSTAMVLVVVVVMMVGIAIGILQGKVSMEILFPTIIGLLIVMACIYAMYGIATQIQNAFGY